MSELNKHLITEDNTVKCQICGKELEKIDGRHTSKVHKIKFDEYRKMYPDNPTITRNAYDKELESIRKRKEAKEKKDNEIKTVKCIYYDDCQNFVEVNKNVPNSTVVCDNCRQEGKEIPLSSRISKSHQTIKQKYGVDNISQLKEKSEKAKETKKQNQEKDPNYISNINAKRNETLRQKYGDNYKEVLKKLKEEGMLEKYGVRHPLQSKEIADSVIESRKKTDQQKRLNQIRNNLLEMNLEIEDEIDNIENAHDKCTVKCLDCGSLITKRVYEIKPGKKICPTCNPGGRKMSESNNRKSTDPKRKRQETVKEKYGVDNIQQIPEVKNKAKNTQQEKYGGVGFSSSELADKARSTQQEKYGADNYMKTEEGRNRFRKPRDEETRQKISAGLKGKKSSNKGKNYEEIYGQEKSEKLRQFKSKQGANQYKQDVLNRLDEMNVELIDEDYNGGKHEHNFRCKVCGNEFVYTYHKLKRRKTICDNCGNMNPKPDKK